MSSITLPSQFMVSQFNLRLASSQRVMSSPFGGSEQAIDMLNDRWTCSIEVEFMNYNEAAYIEAFIAAMRGQVNTVNLYHFVRPVPNGTMRGTPTLSSAGAQGASTIYITGTGTLRAGDMLGLSTAAGPILVMVASDVTLGTATAVTLVNRLRAATNSSTVTWSAPAIPFRLLTTSGVQYVPFVANATTFDFAEVI